MIHTTDGFVAVSDGKGTNTKKPSMHEEKIFQLKGPCLHLICGTSGAASILDADGTTDVLKRVYRPIIEGLAKRDFQTLTEYADAVMAALGPVLHKELKESAPLRDWELSPNEPFTFRLQFAGYFKKTPGIADRQLSFWREKYCVSDMKTYFPASSCQYSLVGSERIADVVAGGGTELYQYKTPGLTRLKKQDGGTISQREAIDAGREYIKACMTPEAHTLDALCCGGIGGDIRAATLAANGDFNLWVEVPFREEGI